MPEKLGGGARQGVKAGPKVLGTSYAARNTHYFARIYVSVQLVGFLMVRAAPQSDPRLERDIQRAPCVEIGRTLLRRSRSIKRGSRMVHAALGESIVLTLPSPGSEYAGNESGDRASPVHSGSPKLFLKAGIEEMEVIREMAK